MIWKLTRWSPNLNLKTTNGSESTKGSLINLQSILFPSVQPCTNLLDTFCWNPSHPVHLLTEVHLCLPAWCPLQSMVQSMPLCIPDVIITLSSHLNCHAEQFKFDECNNPRCPPNCRTLFPFRTVRTELAKSYNLRWNSLHISCRPQEIGWIHRTYND